MSKLINDVIQVFNGTLNGGIVCCGNTCAVIGSVNDKISNFVKLDGSYTDNWREMGSHSYLDIPINSSISYAVLEWHSTISNNLTDGDMSEQYTPIIFKTPLDTNKIYINPTDSTEAIYTDLYNDKISVKWKDVTNLVSKSGTGYYGVKGIPTAPVGDLLNHNQAPGWSLTVVYSNNNLPQRTVILYMGLKQSIYTVSKQNSAITISGINVPNVPKKANIIVIASNGDPNYYAGLSIYNDISQVNNIGSNYYLGNSVDSTYDNPNSGVIIPYDNVFSGIIMNTNTESSNYGQIETRGTLGNYNNNPFSAIKQLSFQGNRGKLDILGFDISTKIKSLQNQLILAVDTKKLPSAKPRIIVCGVQVDQTDKPVTNVAIPNVNITKTIDKNTILIGDMVTFTIIISNNGSIPINQVILSDTVLKEVIFIKNSLNVNGSNIIGDIFPSNGVNLGTISNYQTVNITYQVKFTSVPLGNIVGINPIISYSYNNANQVQSSSLMGTTSYLTVKSYNYVSISNDMQDVFMQTLNGGVTITGNALTVVGTNNNNTREYISQDGSLTTEWRKNGSQAYLDLPSNSTVVKAILEWNGTIAYGGNIMFEANDPIIFKTPQAVLSITATGEGRFDEGNNIIHSAKWADVTSYVTGYGMYGVNRIPSAQNAAIDNSGKTGWSLTVVYSNSSLPSRFINIKMGLKPNNLNFTPQQRVVSFSGFTIPKTAGKSHLMMVSLDGVPNVKNGINVFNDINNISNNSMQYALGNKASSVGIDPGSVPVVPFDNVFGGFIMNTNTDGSNYGKIETRGTLGNKNNSPYNINSQSSFTGNRARYDILSFDISNAMTADQNNLVALINTMDSNEWILNTVYALQVDQTTISPKISISKMSQRMGVYLGENVTYSITLTNNGIINATGVVLIDSVPQGATLVPNSIVVNGSAINTSIIPSNGITIGNLNIGSSINVTYQVIFNFTPEINPIGIQPIVTYNYVDSNNSNQTASVNGTSNSLFVAYIQKLIPNLNSVQDIYTNTIKGGLTIIGNALTVVGSANNKSREFINELGIKTTDWKQNGSSAILDIPLGSTVVAAYLEWYSSVSANSTEMIESYDPIIFKTPTSNYTIFATGETRFSADSLNINSSKWADVTPYILENGAGKYTINRIPSAQNASVDNNEITGWSLVAIYYNDDLPNRYINVKVGLMPNNQNFTKSQRAVTFTGFTVSPIAPKAYLMMVSANGVPNGKNGLSVYSDINSLNNTGLQYQLGNTSSSAGLDPGTKPIVPYDNIFGGFIMNTNTDGYNYGNIDTRGTLGSSNNTAYNINSEPSFTGNRSKHDILVFDISNKVSVNQNNIITVVEQLDFNSEWVLGMVYGLQIDVASDFVSITNSLTDVYASTLNGGVVIAGNTLSVVGSTNNSVREYTKQNGTLTTDWTQNGSQSTLDFPSGSTVVRAFLEWNGTIAYGGNIMPQANDPVVFITPTATYNVSAIGEARFNEGGGYIHSTKWADVTSYVTASGSYAVNRVPSAQNASTNHGGKTGWSLVVVYLNSSLPNRFINVKIGCNPNNANYSANQRAITFSGFTIPYVPKKTHLMMTVLDGFPNIKNGLSLYSDYSNIGNTSFQYKVGNTASATGSNPGTMPIVPFDNLFGGFIMNTNTESSSYGAIETRATLGSKNNTPYNINSQANATGNRAYYDILAFDISSAMASNQNRLIAVVEGLDFNNEWILNAVYALQVDVELNTLIQPTITVTKTSDVSSINVGASLTYTIVINNTGNLALKSVILIETLPTSSNLVANSLTLNGTTLTGTTLPTSGIVIGDLAIGASVTVTYQIAFTAVPTINPVSINPVVNYSYINSSNTSQIANFTGTSSSLTVNLIPVIPILTVIKKPSRLGIYLGETLTYTIVINNTGPTNATNVILIDQIHQDATLVANSITVNGVTITGTTLPTSGIVIGNLAGGVSATVTYQIIFNAIPPINPVSINPVVNYSFT